jgi:hypothetical protein
MPQFPTQIYQICPRWNGPKTLPLSTGSEQLQATLARCWPEETAAYGMILILVDLTLKLRRNLVPFVYSTGSPVLDWSL